MKGYPRRQRPPDPLTFSTSKSRLIDRFGLQLPHIDGSPREIAFYSNEASADYKLNAFKLFSILMVISDVIDYYEAHDGNHFRFAATVAELWQALNIGVVTEKSDASRRGRGCCG